MFSCGSGAAPGSAIPRTDLGLGYGDPPFRAPLPGDWQEFLQRLNVPPNRGPQIFMGTAMGAVNGPKRRA